MTLLQKRNALVSPPEVDELWYSSSRGVVFIRKVYLDQKRATVEDAAGAVHLVVFSDLSRRNICPKPLNGA
jgi:hypothetical protein